MIDHSSQAPRWRRVQWKIAFVWAVWTGYAAAVFPQNAIDSRDYHTFTDRAGRTLQARVIQVNGPQVTIERRDGRRFTVPASIFSEKDQEFLREDRNASKPPVPTATDVVDVGAENWEPPWVPDLRNPGKKIPLSADQRIDVVILGDGYLASERKDFEDAVKKWYDRFLTFPAWGEFRGAFRVRGLWTPSETHANADQKSYFAVAVTDRKVTDARSKATDSAVFEALDRVEVNRNVQDMRYTHLVVVVLIRDEQGRNPSGRAASLKSADGTTLRVGFGADSHHEFAHAYGGLADEYILDADAQAKGKTPPSLSLLTISNLSFTKELRDLPWSHLSPSSPVNPDPTSVIGALWLGGVAEHGVWHSEARCFMNGSHENWDLAKSKRGAALRDQGRFCFWCEEILVAKTLHRVGQLGDSKDGEALWKNWERLRVDYHRAFDVPARIAAENQKNAQEKLADSPLVELPH